jgi:NAD+ synthase (glutamine-hydrolysing)
MSLKTGDRFFNFLSHGFFRVAAATPDCRVADPAHNAAQTIALLRQADEQSVGLVVFPELGLSAYTCEDLFHQHALLAACEMALAQVLEASRSVAAVAVVGMPVRAGHLLFNCAVVLHQGRILGVVPKTYLPNYGEFYEARQFSSAHDFADTHIQLLDQQVPFGSDLIFSDPKWPLFVLHLELCEDLWVPIPPSSTAALAGATVLANLSASNATVGKAPYRRQLVAQQSARCLAAYVYASAGVGESSTDLAWDGHSMVAENGEILIESERFSDTPSLTIADVDLERLSHERMRQTSFGRSMRDHSAAIAGFRRVPLSLTLPTNKALGLCRQVATHPYVPAHAAQRDERCQEVFQIQVQALAQRLKSSGLNKVVVGVSGGLDSTHALLVAVKAMDHLKLPRAHVLGYTMPGYATSGRTLDQATRLMQVVGCTAEYLDIRPSCDQMLKDIGHPYSQGQPLYDITFENVQAGERTSHLFRLANHHQALVLGTGDLSELALGWCTYGVGDHMSHYNVNASVPKTLIRYLVRWVAERELPEAADQQVLLDVLDTQISPELVPSSDTSALLQLSEATVGAYDLQDFNLYYTLRFGYAPSKIAFLASHAWKAQLLDNQVVDLPRIKSTLEVFVKRFFSGSQFKRSCVPNGPKVGSGGSLSPRGDWRAPSDSKATPWLQDWAQIPDTSE